MNKKIAPVCHRHNLKKKWRATMFEYRDEGIVVSIPNVPAWVYPEDGEVSFHPDTTDELIATVRELVDIAKRAKIRQASFTEYVVIVG